MKQDKLHKIFQSSPDPSEEVIEGYLRGELNAEERFVIENKMLDDPFFSDAIEGYADSNIDFSANTKIENFDDFFQRMDVPKEAVVRNIRPQRTRIYQLMAAASVVLLVAFGAFFLMNDTAKISNEQLFAMNFEIAKMDIPQLRGDSATDISAEINPLLQSAIDSYQKRDFKTSLESFNKYIVEVNPDNNFALFHAGICALEMNDLDIAFQNFTKLYVHKGEFYEEANWYLALTSIQRDDRNGARELLSTLLARTSNPELKSSAAQLMESL
jgi:hypothetical protein